MGPLKIDVFDYFDKNRIWWFWRINTVLVVLENKHGFGGFERLRA